MTDFDLKKFGVVGIDHEAVLELQQDSRDNHHFTVRSTRTLLRAEAIEIQEQYFGYPQLGYGFMYFALVSEVERIFTYRWSCSNSCD